MKYEYSDLKGAMVQKGYTQVRLADEMNLTKEALNMKLNNHRYFTQGDITKIMKILGLKDVRRYFFTEL